ncbi:MAG: hypothetical protein HQK73_12010 [Desulfamplus sp.]|nr:hypothetical protein [Desulfamplus sp.]
MTILQIVMGISLLSFGIYGIVTNWWGFVELANLIIEICFVLFGVFSIMVGISRIKEKKR